MPVRCSKPSAVSGRPSEFVLLGVIVFLSSFIVSTYPHVYAGAIQASKLVLDLIPVGGLSAVVGVAEDWAEDGERGGVVEDRAEGDGRWLDWWQICEGRVSECSFDEVLDAGEAEDDVVRCQRIDVTNPSLAKHLRLAVR